MTLWKTTFVIFVHVVAFVVLPFHMQRLIVGIRCSASSQTRTFPMRQAKGFRLVLNQNPWTKPIKSLHVNVRIWWLRFQFVLKFPFKSESGWNQNFNNFNSCLNNYFGQGLKLWTATGRLRTGLRGPPQRALPQSARLALLEVMKTRIKEWRMNFDWFRYRSIVE